MSLVSETKESRAIVPRSWPLQAQLSSRGAVCCGARYARPARSRRREFAPRAAPASLACSALRHRAQRLTAAQPFEREQQARRE
ncbi:hypothetical protein, partial [Burkholderia multivorans]|uniref:hypothetical protein n=1 Tax=Burkholderia multivorans TaxID=87883 RepID=UPI0021BE3A95